MASCDIWRILWHTVHMNLRRDGENPVRFESDDSFTSINFIDKLEKLDDLPTYDIDNSDAMPYIR